MKVCYLNDESVQVKVRITNQDGDNEHPTLSPHEMKVFEVHAPEGLVLFVKKWGNHIALLSHMLLVALDELHS